MLLFSGLLKMFSHLFPPRKIENLSFWLIWALMILPQLTNAQQVKNVIFFIGDGMGISQVTASRIYLRGASGRFELEKMPVSGLVTTHSVDKLITDSAAGATAMATGYKTRNGVVGMSPDSIIFKTVLEAVKELGKSTGLIATSSITHATPACFASHVISRSQQAEIARQFIELGVEVILGGGKQYFIPQSVPGSKRQDSLNLLEYAFRQEYEVIENKTQLNRTRSDKVLGLFAMGELKREGHQPSLANMTQKALEILNRDPEGFFLMVEGSQIDWAGHDNDFPGLVREMASFDSAVAVGLEFSQKNENTLVIVTADHETGGLLITGGDVDGKNIDVDWHYTAHTGQMVPLFAAGAGSPLFSGIKDNTDIALTLGKLFDLQNFPQAFRAEKVNFQ